MRTTIGFFMVLATFAPTSAAWGNVQLKLGMAMQKVLDDNGVTSADDFLAKIAPSKQLRFTFNPSSDSLQHGQRALMFDHRGTAFFGIGAHSKGLEAILVDATTGRTEFRLATPSKGNLQLGEQNPTSCTRCHTRRFVFIFDDYDQWPTMLGADDDHIKGKDIANYKTVRENAKWAPLFGMKGPGNSDVFPYYSGAGRQRASARGRTPVGEVNPLRKFENLPNFHMTALVGRRAARSLFYNISTENPSLYHRYKYFLASEILHCYREHPPSDEEQKTMEADYAKLVPKEFQMQKEITATFGDPSRHHLVLQILGINPDEIILKSPIRAKAPTERLKEVGAQFRSGALEFFNGDHTRIRDHLVGAMAPSLDVKGLEPRPAADEYAKSTNTFAPENLTLLDSVSIAYGTTNKSHEPTCRELRERSAAALRQPLSTATGPLSRGIESFARGFLRKQQDDHL